MISQLALDVYERSVQLKRYDERKLLFKRNRIALLKELNELQDKIDLLLSLLRNDSDFSYNCMELAMFMKASLSECSTLLIANDKNERITIKRYVWGFHNLPRAFFSIDDRRKISPETAMEYFKPYGITN